MDRIQKIIAHAGICSRRKAEELMVEGRVKVNGVVVTELGAQANATDQIEVDGQLIAGEDKVIYLLNKPLKTLCTVKDDKGRATVLDLIDDKRRLYPVGRLDYETTGVLFVTNDGDFANAMTHPTCQMEKTYEVAIDGILTLNEVSSLRKGIELEDGWTLPAKVHVVSMNEAKAKEVLLITIHEGRNREIRRMIEHFGYIVTRLDRKQVGTVTCEGLKRGEYRLLKPFEQKTLMKIAKKH